jgi:hypothetical protein
MHAYWTSRLQQSKSTTDEETHLAYDQGIEHGEILQEWNEDNSSMQPIHPHPSTTQNPIKNDAQQSQERRTSDYHKIGAVLINPKKAGFKFSCDEDVCAGKIFGRASELRRHYYTFHERGENIWCPESSCSRSEAVGNDPFPNARMDKLKEHALKQHGLELEF